MRSLVASSVALAAVALSGPPASAQWLGLELTGPSAAEELSDPDAEVRARAAHTLGRHGDPSRAVAALVDALGRERDVAVRREVLLALGRRGDEAAVPALVEALAPGQSPDVAAVAHALGAFDTDPALRALVGVLEHAELSEVVIAALARHGPRAVPHLVLALANDAQSNAAARALGAIGDTRAVPALVGLLAVDRVGTRLAALDALGDIGDERATSAIAALLDDDEPVVVRGAVRALGEIGASAEAPRLEALLGRDDAPLELRRTALDALVRVAPERAVPILEAHARTGDADLGGFALDLALQIRHPAVSPLLHGLIREGSRADEAASALAELEAGGGLAVLVHVGSTSRDHDDAITRALAVAVRKWATEADPELVRSSRALLASRPATPRMLLLRAVARDGAVRPALERALSSDDAAARALAAQGLEALGDAGAVRALTAALEHETDDETFRRSTSALASLGGTHPVRPLVARFADEEVAPEAMLLAASELESESRSTRRRVGAALRRALHASEPRVRVGAAWALAVSGDRSAFRALGVALDDREPEVRHAVARALAILREPLARPLLEARARIEEDPSVREALVDALELDRRFPAAGLRGNETLRVRIRTTSGRAHGPVPVDVVLPDGRYLRLRTLASGELILVDLPLGTADVRARVEG